MSEVKVNKISPRSGTTVTLGDSGDTFTIPSGATINNQGTAVNFGATGSASWVTTVKTGDFTAVAGEGYFINTTSGEVDVTLPAGTAGAVVAVKDYAGTFNTNKVTLIPNGSDKIGGNNTIDGTLETPGIAVTLVFIDSTQGWLVTDSGLQSEVPTGTFLTATGGAVTESGNCKIHTFTGPGTFQVTTLSCTPANNVLAYAVVAGGGGGGWEVGGGGGAGGFREGRNNPITPYTASPLAAACSALTATVASFPITVGAAGTGGDPGGSYPSPSQAPSGSVSTFSTITSAGGGGAGNYNGTPGVNGGSGGGGAGLSGPGGAGTGNTPPVTPAQGTNGGTGSVGPVNAGGGGGGATVAGSPGTSITSAGPRGPRAAGATSEINGTPVQYAQGGRGASDPSPGPCGAAGGANTGTGGDGGGANPVLGFAGGSGVVIIRYRYQ